MLILTRATSWRYRGDAVTFDGSNDYLSKAAAWTGVTSSKVGTGCFFLKFNGGNGAAQYVLADSSLSTWGQYLQRTTANKLQFKFQHSSGGAAGLNATSGGTLTADSLYHSVLFSWNNATPSFQLYIDDVADTPAITFQTDHASEWSHAPVIGRRESGVGYLNADLFDFWFDVTIRLDLSVVANRRKFVTADNRPVFLGSNGELPLGTDPTAFHHADRGAAASTFATNLGTGGGMTENGALAIAASSPTG